MKEMKIFRDRKGVIEVWDYSLVFTKSEVRTSFTRDDHVHVFNIFGFVTPTLLFSDLVKGNC